MSDTSTKRAEEVATIHQAHAMFKGFQWRAFREETAAILRALAAERDALKAQLAAVSKNDILVNVSEVIRAYKNGGSSWAYNKMMMYGETPNLRVETAVMINGDLEKVLKFAADAVEAAEKEP